MRNPLPPTRVETTRFGGFLECMLTMALVGLLPTANAHAQYPASEQQPASTPSEPVTVTVVFMPIAKERDEAELQAEFEDLFPAFAEEHGLLDAGSAGEPELIFRLQIQQTEGRADSYMIHSTAIYHGKVHTEDARSCMKCSPAAVVASALTNLAAAVELVIENRAEYAAANAEAAAMEAQPEAPSPPPALPPVRTFGPVMCVGFSSMGLGLGGVISGWIVFDRGDKLDPDRVTSKGDNYRRAGLGLLGTGIGLSALGLVLVTVDATVLLPRREARAWGQARVDGVSFTVAGSPGLLVTGRF